MKKFLRQKNFKNVILKKIDHLGVLQINRIKQKNSLNIETSLEIIQGLKKLEREEDINCIAIIGNEKIFSPGADIKELDKLSLILKEKKIKNIKLPVSAPFHCELMRTATLKMKQIINEQTFKDPSYKVISNVTANEYKNPEQIKQLLIQQIESPVRWRETIQFMILNGSNTFVEIGPGKVLSGLIKRIDKEVNVLNIDKVEDIQGINL